MKILFILMIILSSCSIDKKIINKINNNYTNNSIGEITRKNIENNVWFKKEYYSYKLDINTLSNMKKEPLLSKKLNNIHIQIYLGLWCSDTQREIPRLYKILDHIGYDTKKIYLYAVKNDKIVYVKNKKNIVLNYVPTIIIYNALNNKYYKYEENFGKKSIEQILKEII